MRRKHLKLPDFIKRWWTDVLKNPDRLARFLQNLYLAEAGGAVRFQQIVDRFAPSGEDLVCLQSIIHDERAHQEAVREVLIARGIEIPTAPKPIELYWCAWPEPETFEEACAAGTYAEMLALNRFEIIASHTDTPDDLRGLVSKIKEDEARHARLLSEMAKRDTGVMNRLRPFHRQGMINLGLPVGELENDRSREPLGAYV